jgi:RNA polymerase sigma-70 factor (ECF subfamily)
LLVKAMGDTTVGLQFDALLAAAHDEDAALLEGLRSGEEHAYETLIQRFEHPVYNLVARLADDSDDAADVVQEVFIKVFRNVHAFRGDSSLKTWIYRIAVNQARNHRRWFGRHKKQEVGLEPDAGESQGYQDWIADPGPSPFEQALDHETHSLVEAALQEVPAAFRAALVLREIEGLSYEQIADVLEITLGTVKSRILRGREALRKNLAQKMESPARENWGMEGFHKQGCDA